MVKFHGKKENFKCETHMKWMEDFSDADSLSISFSDRYKQLWKFPQHFLTKRKKKKISLQLNEINNLSI